MVSGTEGRFGAVQGSATNPEPRLRTLEIMPYFVYLPSSKRNGTLGEPELNPCHAGAWRGSAWDPGSRFAGPGWQRLR